MRHFDALLAKIEQHRARISVLGLGYVGLPLAVSFAERGFKVEGLDLDERKAKAVCAGESYIPDVPAEDIARLGNTGMLTAGTDFSVLGKADIAIICVPTPL